MDGNPAQSRARNSPPHPELASGLRRNCFQTAGCAQNSGKASASRKRGNPVASGFSYTVCKTTGHKFMGRRESGSESRAMGVCSSGSSSRVWPPMEKAGSPHMAKGSSARVEPDVRRRKIKAKTPKRTRCQIHIMVRTGWQHPYAIERVWARLTSVENADHPLQFS